MKHFKIYVVVQHKNVNAFIVFLYKAMVNMSLKEEHHICGAWTIVKIFAICFATNMLECINDVFMIFFECTYIFVARKPVNILWTLFAWNGSEYILALLYRFIVNILAMFHI